MNSRQSLLNIANHCKIDFLHAGKLIKIRLMNASELKNIFNDKYSFIVGFNQFRVNVY